MRHPLEPLREYYLDCFRQSVEKARARFDPMTTELLLELPSLKHPEYCHRLYRVDIIGKQDGKDGILEVNVTPKGAIGWRKMLPRVAQIAGTLDRFRQRSSFRIRRVAHRDLPRCFSDLDWFLLRSAESLLRLRERSNQSLQQTAGASR